VGESETVLGEVLAGIPDVTITTKIGIPRPSADTAPHLVQIAYRRFVRPALSYFPGLKSKLLKFADRRSPPVTYDRALQRPRTLTRGEVLRELEDSMKRLKRDRLDLYLLHEPDQFSSSDELSELFEELKRARVIGAFGLAYGRTAEAAPNFGSVIQSRYRSDLRLPSDTSRTRIFHGVLRYGWNEIRDRSGGPSKYLKEVLEDYPDATVIFSASSPGQIRAMMRISCCQSAASF
jgi:hypothetical protein